MALFSVHQIPSLFHCRTISQNGPHPIFLSSQSLLVRLGQWIPWSLYSSCLSWHSPPGFMPSHSRLKWIFWTLQSNDFRKRSSSSSSLSPTYQILEASLPRSCLLDQPHHHSCSRSQIFIPMSLRQSPWLQLPQILWALVLPFPSSQHHQQTGISITSLHLSRVQL